MARKIFQIIIILLFCAACTSRHEEMLQRLDELDAMAGRYEAMPNDTVAMDVVAHMERCGTLAERERAWKMVAKVYRRRGWNFYEESAWSMAVGCVDTTQAFDTLAWHRRSSTGRTASTVRWMMTRVASSSTVPFATP